MSPTTYCIILYERNKKEQNKTKQNRKICQLFCSVFIVANNLVEKERKRKERQKQLSFGNKSYQVRVTARWPTIESIAKQ